ncbi:MAG: ribosome biogenesis GTPase Der [Acidobacteriota bacterium]
MNTTPMVAIVGRPNVGKSTLFNRLVGKRQAIVHDQPGVTRDRIVGTAELQVDREIDLVDTGGLVPGDDPLGLNKQVFLAVEESDLLVLVVDGREGLVPADEQVWEHFRQSGKATLVVVNKGDTRQAQEGFTEFYSLGAGDPILLSAEHGEGIDSLREAILGALTEVPAATVPEDASPVAIVGRPNVGKSSLLNRLLGQERSLVTPVAGTTRDPIDTLVEAGERHLMLIDTAGIRRRAKVSDTPEELAVMMSRRQIQRAKLAVLVIDASAGVTSNDLAIAGTIWELGRAAVVVVNKWDLLDEEGRERLDLSMPRLEELLADPLRVNISAATGRAVEKVFPAIDRALTAFDTRLGTSEVNRLFAEALRRHKPPAQYGKPWKAYYATQVSSEPPTFMLFANRTLKRADTYRRYLVNSIRRHLDLPGVPIRLVIRQRARR